MRSQPIDAGAKLGEFAAGKAVAARPVQAPAKLVRFPAKCKRLAVRNRAASRGTLDALFGLVEIANQITDRATPGVMAVPATVVVAALLPAPIMMVLCHGRDRGERCGGKDSRDEDLTHETTPGALLHRRFLRQMSFASAERR
jgi:hypothetical protein